MFKCTQFTKVCGQQGVGLLKVGLSQIQNHCRGCYKWVCYQLLAKCLLYQLTMNEVTDNKVSDVTFVYLRFILVIV